jgi:tetratricopeptide (TPR) repeat protein
VLQNLSWFLVAFATTLGVLAVMRYRLSVYEQSLDLKNTLQEISQEVALGYFQHCFNKLNELTFNSFYKAQIDVLKAQCLLGLGRKEELMDFLKRTLEHYPENHTARRMLAKLLVDNGDGKQALDHFKLLKGKHHEDDLLARATAYYQIQDYTNCQKLIEAESKHPHGQLLSLLADALFAQDHWAIAIDYYKKAENLGWRPISQIAKKGQAYLFLHKYQEAEPCFREWLRANPQNSEGAVGLARCLQCLGQYLDSIQILQAFELELSEDVLANATLGRCYFLTKNYPKATHYLLNAYELNCSDPITPALAAISLEKQQQWRHAEAIYQNLIKDHVEHFIGYGGLAYLFAIGRVKNLTNEHAIEYALKTVELNPCISSWEILSASYARCGLFEKAHQIQESLMKYSADEEALTKRRDAMRALRQHKVLEASSISQLEVI